MAERKKELVFIPSEGIGHIFATIEVAKFLAEQNEDLAITILIMKSPNNATNPIPTSHLHPQISFIEIRKSENHPQSSYKGVSMMQFFDFVDAHKTHVREIIAGIARSGKTRLAGIVVDMICTCMIDVAEEFKVPSFVFFSSGAAMLGLMFHFQSLKDESNVDVMRFKDSGEELKLPTYVNLVPATVLPEILFYKDGSCDAFLNLAKRYREAKGILINTLTDLESHAIRSLSEDESIPPVYPIGPVLKLDGISDNRNRESAEIIQWMDLQPVSSVLFLCFGSMGSFPVNQVKEIAVALEKTGFRFLWSLRKPGSGLTPPGNYEDPGEVLPEGFLERTAEVGKVIGWAPQAAVLGHPAVAGFVSHCGWNSVLESVWNGVPMAAWPIYSEQQVNAFLLVKDLDLAVEIKMDYKKEFGDDNVEIVSADLIENGLRKLMDSGNGMRKKMKEMKEKSRLAIVEGGSSFASLSSFMDVVRDNVFTG